MEKDQRLSLSLVFNLVLALEKTRACTVPYTPNPFIIILPKEIIRQKV
jgi:hypothetical protein